MSKRIYAGFPMAFAFAATLFAITPSAVAAHSERHLQVVNSLM